jgi:hypothetical protein
MLHTGAFLEPPFDTEEGCTIAQLGTHNTRGASRRPGISLHVRADAG